MAQTTANLVGSSYISKSVAMPSESSPADEENPEIQVPTGARSPTKAREGWKRRASSFHRVVEQIENEPTFVVIFKWTLIVIGLAMLGAVLFFMGEVIYDWSSGKLEQERKIILESLANMTISQTQNTTDADDLL